VWAGAALVLGGGVATYQYFGRQPTTAQGF